MFYSIVLFALLSVVYADNYEYTKYLSNGFITCQQNRELAVGIVCNNGCNEIKVRCIDTSSWGVPGELTMSLAPCNSGGSSLLFGFNQYLQPVCQKLFKWGVPKSYERHCVDHTITDDGKGANCKRNQVISKINVDRSKKTVSFACCQDNDHFAK